jgi:hypothetical protein
VAAKGGLDLVGLDQEAHVHQHLLRIVGTQAPSWVGEKVAFRQGRSVRPRAKGVAGNKGRAGEWGLMLPHSWRQAPDCAEP